MINPTDDRPNYRQAITCLNCEFGVDANARGYVQALECTKHDNWTVEAYNICDDHPLLQDNTPNPEDMEIIDIKELQKIEQSDITEAHKEDHTISAESDISEKFLTEDFEYKYETEDQKVSSILEDTKRKYNKRKKKRKKGNLKINSLKESSPEIKPL